jgi:hypothetical protein
MITIRDRDLRKSNAAFRLVGTRLMARWPQCSKLLPALSLVLGLYLLGIPYDLHAAMYVCREKSGAISYTNVPGNPGCNAFALKKNGWVSTGRSYTSGKAAYDPDIRRIGKRYNVDPPLIKAIIHTESDFNHRAVSKRGALGLMQLMPDTARELQVANPFDPKENIEGGTRYFRQMLDNFNNDLILSLAAYNAGPGLVRRTGGVPKIAETRRYVYKVLRQYKVYKASW